MNSKNNDIKIVTVANNLETFDKVIKNNENVKDFEKFLYNNSNENIGIPERYNSFINENVKPDSDFWIIFCHQDFGFDKNPRNIIKKLDKNDIYGAIGVGRYVTFNKIVKQKLTQKLGYYPSVKINLKNFLSKDDRFIKIEKLPISEDFSSRKFIGQIKQGKNNSEFYKFGKKIINPKEVSNLDCCCLMVHSSLINKYNLRFDENLDWHMYVEDFCMNAKINHDVKIKVAQFNCFHLGIGNINDSFYKAVTYVKNKYNLEHLSTTCYDE